MSDEKRMILDMLAEGKITAEEAEKLLNKTAEPENTNDSNTKKFLHIKVDDGDKTTVNINLPLVLAETGLKLIPKEQLKIIEDKGVNIDDIRELVQNGTADAIMDIDTVEDGKNIKVKIFID